MATVFFHNFCTQFVIEGHENVPEVVFVMQFVAVAACTVAFRDFCHFMKLHVEIVGLNCRCDLKS